jgi:hypothetical protein
MYPVPPDWKKTKNKKQKTKKNPNDGSEVGLSAKELRSALLLEEKAKH